MSRRRQQRGAAKERRHAQPPTTVHEATRVERLAYTRTQAAEALGISRSTFNRRVLPYVETVEMPWGARLRAERPAGKSLAQIARDLKPAAH